MAALECYTIEAMTPSRIRQTALRIEPELLEALHGVKERDGIPVSEQVRRAVRAWLAERGVSVKAAPRRAGTRRKA